MRSETTALSNLDLVAFELGLAMTNTYLLGDPDRGEAIVIDPAWDGEFIVEEARNRNWRITSIWLTHAHFDHFGGAGAIVDAVDPPVPIAMSFLDMPLWRVKGGAALFGVPEFDPGPEPSIDLTDGMKLNFGGHMFEVRHTPGHSPGHIILKSDSLGAVFCGDLIFQGSVGRTDLPGGSWEQLIGSIEREILILPDDTLLFTGHGPMTKVGIERGTNPFLAEITS
jgi:glyoxylase-like metal-dependent hydrolase (beta-lactamase superfamily II)